MDALDVIGTLKIQWFLQIALELNNVLFKSTLEIFGELIRDLQACCIILILQIQALKSFPEHGMDYLIN